MPDLNREASELRREAAERYRPPTIKLLLVGESPPPLLSRYFYFEDVDHHDGLFWNIVKALTGAPRPEPERKREYLAELVALGVWFIDLKPDPEDPLAPATFLDALIQRCEALRPARIVIIKPNVFDLAFLPLKNAGLPVVNRRVPFPASGNQLEFATAFVQAMKAPVTAPGSAEP
jgi:hypothetical protein